MGGGGGGGLSCSFLKYNKIASLPTQFCTNEVMLILIYLNTYLSNIMVSSTSQMKSQEIIAHIKQPFMTTRPLKYVTIGIHNFVKMLY